MHTTYDTMIKEDLKRRLRPSKTKVPWVIKIHVLKYIYRRLKMIENENNLRHHGRRQYHYYSGVFRNKSILYDMEREKFHMDYLSYSIRFWLEMCKPHR
jgi:hypothetical protein